MAEKILNTRILLKYDTLANWNASTFKLKAGELAIVTLGNTKDGTTAGEVNQHPVLFKVGDGNHTFAELPFASALAADVYAWAKAADIKLNGKTLQFLDASNSIIKSIEFKYVTSEEVNNTLAAYSTTEQMNAAIKAEADRAKGVEDDLAGRLDDVEAALGTNGSVAEQIATEIGKLDSSATQTAGTDGLALGVTLVDGKVTAITGSIAANTYDAHGAAAAAEGRAATDAQSKADAALESAKTYAEQKAAAAQEAAEGKVTALADGAVADNTAAIAAINNTESGILAQAKAYADQAETDAITAANTYTDNVKKAILGEGITETFDTLVEIQNWINGDGVNATELAEAIAEEARIRGEADNTLQTNINNVVNGNTPVAKATLADKASALDATAVEQVKGIKVNNAVNADKANSLTDAAKDEVKAVKVDNAATADNAVKLGGVVAADYALKTDAQGYANTAETNAKSYTDTRETAIKTAYETYADQAETDAVDAAKVYTDGLAKNYATAEQGSKADAALQEIEAGEGLKVNVKADNKQKIEIDDAVVFVLYAGSATENI